MEQMKKIVAYCGTCGKITAMAIADADAELLSAARDAKEWEDQGRKTGMVEHAGDDPMPEWCRCAASTSR